MRICRADIVVAMVTLSLAREGQEQSVTIRRYRRMRIADGYSSLSFSLAQMLDTGSVLNFPSIYMCIYVLSKNTQASRDHVNNLS